jgi:hypothetical protein
MKKTLVSIVTLVVVLFSFCVPSKAATITETSVWNNYTLFSVPILVDDSTSLQALYITDIGDKGWSFMMWSAFDTDGSGGNEIDINLRKRWDIGKFSITAAVGYWNITDLETIDGDIGIESVTIAHTGFTPLRRNRCTITDGAIPPRHWKPSLRRRLRHRGKARRIENHQTRHHERFALRVLRHIR